MSQHTQQPNSGRGLNDAMAERFYADGVHATGAVTVQVSPDELYRVWRELEDLPRFIDHLNDVEKIDEQRSRWTVRGPGNRRYSWEASIIRDEPGRLIVWKTDNNAEVHSAGTVMFRCTPRGTEVRVSMEYLPPGGKLGEAVAKLAKVDAKTLVQEGLHRFRQLMETGEIPTIEGQPVGQGPQDSSETPGRIPATTFTQREVRDVAGRDIPGEELAGRQVVDTGEGLDAPGDIRSADELRDTTLEINTKMARRDAALDKEEA